MTTLSDIQRAQVAADTILYAESYDESMIVHIQDILWILDDFANVHKELDRMDVTCFAGDGTELSILQRIEWALEEFRNLQQITHGKHSQGAMLYHPPQY